MGWRVGLWDCGAEEPMQIGEAGWAIRVTSGCFPDATREPNRQFAPFPNPYPVVQQAGALGQMATGHGIGNLAPLRGQLEAERRGGDWESAGVVTQAAALGDFGAIPAHQQHTNLRPRRPKQGIRGTRSDAMPQSRCHSRDSFSAQKRRDAQLTYIILSPRLVVHSQTSKLTTAPPHWTPTHRHGR